MKIKFLLTMAVLSTAILGFTGLAIAQTTAPTCPSGMTWDTTSNWCSSAPTCPTGTVYDVTNNSYYDVTHQLWCVSTPPCPSGTTWNGTYSQCNGGTPPCPAGQTEVDHGVGDNTAWTCYTSPTCPSGQRLDTYESADTTLPICAITPSCPAGQARSLNGNNVCIASPIGTINGVCGSANGVASVMLPSQNLCVLGTNFHADCDNMTSCQNWVWTCHGYNGGTDTNCSAPRLSSAITVTSPSAGQSWQPGTTHNITWTSSNLSTNALLNIDLVTSPLDAPSTLSNSLLHIADSISQSTGSYSWTIPSNTAAANNYKIMIQTVIGNGIPSVLGTSGFFLITSSSSTVLSATCSASPNQALTGATVTWTAIATGGNGTYTYAWSGAASGTASTTSYAYPTAGTKNVTVVVKSNGKTVTAHCSEVVNLDVASKITCIGNAVHVRDTTLGTAMATYTTAINSAYITRITALQQAYSLTTLAAVRTARDAAWTTFKTAIKAAHTAWTTARNTAWATYRTVGTACGAPANTGDGSYSSAEPAGN